MSRYRFVLRPRWIVSHIFVGAMVVMMINLGFWQVSRLQEKKDRNAQVVERYGEAPATASSLADPGSYGTVGGIEYRQVSAEGTYLANDEVIVRSRSRDGAPGSWVLTPLDLGDGTALIVNRGWIPNSGQHIAVPKDFAAPDGPITVSGLARAPETRSGLGATDPPDGTLTDLARADVARLDTQIDLDLLPFYLQLETQDPALTSSDPDPVPPPALDEGSHLSYAVQWFLFSVMTTGAYVLILRRRARELELEAR